AALYKLTVFLHFHKSKIPDHHTQHTSLDRHSQHRLVPLPTAQSEKAFPNHCPPDPALTNLAVMRSLISSVAPRPPSSSRRRSRQMTYSEWWLIIVRGQAG